MSHRQALTVKDSHDMGSVRGFRRVQDHKSEATVESLRLDPRELTFPFQSAVLPGESGQGYALRMAAENHLNGLQQIKILLGKSRFATLDALDTPWLHRWFGATEMVLDHALGWTHTGRNREGYVYAGQLLGRSYFLNRSYPRICFQCLQAQGYCHSAWDFSLAVACAKHRTVLSDICPSCIRPLSWNRPAPGFCSCFIELSSQTDTSPATLLEVQFATWIERHVKSEPTSSFENDRFTQSMSPDDGVLMPLIELLWPLSLNGGMHVTYALATAAGYQDSQRSVSPRPRSPLKKSQHILLMANECAKRTGRSATRLHEIQRPSAVIQLLADCMSGGAPTADRHLAQSLLATVLHQNRKTRWSGAYPQLSQLLLF